MNITALEEWAGHTFLLQILHRSTPGVFLSICVGHSLQHFPDRFLLLVLVGEDHLAFQSFSGHFSHLTSDSFGLKATLYVIIGEFLTKLFQELLASSLSIIERPVWIP